MSTLKIVISISDQIARLMDGERQLKFFAISSATNGTGYVLGSNTTPLGRFKVHKKIGEDCVVGTVFKGRVPTGEIWTDSPSSPLWQSSEDLILSRILWLEGVEDVNANTKDRYIYLHGTNHEHLLGKPASHGCIRFGNNDIIELFALVEEGTDVLILT